MTTNRPGSGGNGSIAGRYQRRDAPRDEATDARSSGTANARRHHGSTKHCAHEQTLAAQLEKPSTQGPGGLRAHGVATRQEGVGDPSDMRLELKDAFMKALPCGAMSG